jgi:TPR repeat protein
VFVAKPKDQGEHVALVPEDGPTRLGVGTRKLLTIVASLALLTMFGVTGAYWYWTSHEARRLGEDLAAGNFASIPKLKRLADKGIPDAQFWLGAAYVDGQGVAKDLREAIRLFRLAGEKGQPEAQSSIAHLYFDERRTDLVSKDEALTWLRKAAEGGQPYAQATLSGLYSRGDNVPKSDAEAVRLMLMAATNGYSYAQLMMAKRFLQGDGVGRDDGKAIDWLRLSAAQQNTMALELLGSSYADGRGVSKDLVKAYMWKVIAAANSPNEPFVRWRDEVGRQLTQAQRDQGYEDARVCVQKKKLNNCD